MPQADLYITADQSVDAAKVLPAIEATMSAFDDFAGACKGRVHKVNDYHHSHFLLQVSMLPKDHRDADYAATLGAKLAEILRPYGKSGTAIAVNIKFDLAHYTAIKID